MSLTMLADTVNSSPTMRLLLLLVEASVKGSALLLLAWVATRFMRTGSAASRHLAWAIALAGMLAMPILSIALPPLSVSGLPRLRPADSLAVRSPASQIERQETVTISAVSTTTRSDPVPVSEAPAAAPLSVDSAMRFAPLVWLAVAALVLLRLAAGMLRVSMWTRRARPIVDGAWLSLAQRLSERLHIARPVMLLRSDRACVPMTWGVVYPTVLLPVDADDWTGERRTLVLLHELAHVKRLDAFTQLVAQVAVALFWFNPLVWLAARQMRTEREHACDDFVLAGGARPTDYAHDLLQIARSLGGSSAPAAAALAMARRGEFEGRLLAILDPKANRHDVSRARLVLSTVAVLGLTLPLAALTPAQRVVTPTISRDTSLIVAQQAPVTLPAPAPSRKPLPKKPSVPVATPAAPVVEAQTPEMSPPIVVASIPRRFIAIAFPFAAPLIAPTMPVGTVPDLETLIAVTRQAAKMTSDFDKAELLVTVAKHYIRDDELRTAYIDAVATMSSSYDQTRSLLPMLLADDLPPQSVAQVVKISSRITSDNDKATLFVNTVTHYDALTASTRDAIIAATATIKSDYDRRRTIVAIVARGGLTNPQVADLLRVVKTMSGSFDKASALLAVSAAYPLSDKVVRDAFMEAAESISSASDYRRVMANVLNK